MLNPVEEEDIVEEEEEIKGEEEEVILIELKSSQTSLFFKRHN